MRNTSTLSECLDQIEQYLADEKIVLAYAGESPTGSIVRDPFAFDGINYGQYKTANYQIQTLKGKPIKKCFHVTITRLDRGFYEPVAYVL